MELIVSKGTFFLSLAFLLVSYLFYISSENDKDLMLNPNSNSQVGIIKTI